MGGAFGWEGHGVVVRCQEVSECVCSVFSIRTNYEKTDDRVNQKQG